MPQNYRGPVGLLAFAAALIFGLVQLFTGEKDGTAPPVPSEIASGSPAPNGSVTVAAEQERPAVVSGAAPAPSHTAIAPSGDFDYYIVALTWSPSYCLEDGDPRRDRLQCQSSRPFAFVLHGLWPQNERGYPENCATDQPRVPDSVIDTMMDIMPSRGLAGHEWRKHGACTGLDHEGYFAASRAAFAAVKIPPEFKAVTQYVSTTPAKVEQAFLAANPGLARDGVTITCSRKHLREVRVCMTKDLKFRTCGADARRDCDQRQIVMPPSRGGR